MNSSTEILRAGPEQFMRFLLQRIATGPDLSKDISLEEARAGMRLILEGRVDPVQAGIFLIALRMKRETDEENIGILDAIRDLTRTAIAPVDEIVEIADPYDGYIRTLPCAPFLPAVLAALGVAAVSTGLESVGPKFGVTHRQVLQAAGVPVDLSPEEAAARLGDPSKGWAYVDQKAYCPALHELVGLRTLIVKRPAISTVETMAGPLRGRRKTHLVTGYVHKPYPRIYALLARHAGFNSALIVRGVEGGVIPSLRQTGKCFYYHDRGEEQSLEFRPVDFGIEQSVRAAPIPEEFIRTDEEGDAVPDNEAVAKAAVAAGLEALEGEEGPVRDALVCGSALCLRHLGRYASLDEAAAAVRETLDSGTALDRFSG